MKNKTNRKRYLKVKIEGLNADEATARRGVNEAVFSFLGEKQAAQARVQFISWNAPYAIVRCSHFFLTEVVAALALKRFFQGKDIALRVEKVSGTLAGLRGRKASQERD